MIRRADGDDAAWHRRVERFVRILGDDSPAALADLDRANRSVIEIPGQYNADDPSAVALCGGRKSASTAGR